MHASVDPHHCGESKLIRSCRAKSILVSPLRQNRPAESLGPGKIKRSAVAPGCNGPFHDCLTTKLARRPTQSSWWGVPNLSTSSGRQLRAYVTRPRTTTSAACICRSKCTASRTWLRLLRISGAGQHDQAGDVRESPIPPHQFPWKEMSPQLLQVLPFSVPVLPLSRPPSAQAAGVLTRIRAFKGTYIPSPRC